MDLEQIQQLMTKLEESKLKKLVLKKGDFELQLEKEGEIHIQPMIPSSHHVQRALVDETSSEASQRGERGGSRKVEMEGTYVSSPMVGTFYSSAAPDQPPFVKIGDRVEEGTVVCIIEAMKVMNEVKAGASGIIAEILADDAQPVEFGTKLLRIHS